MGHREIIVHGGLTRANAGGGANHCEPVIVPQRQWFLFVKEIFDRVAAVLIAIITSPLLVTAALVVKCTSPGPVFYHQVRLGRYGREFTLYKLRTMVVDAESKTGPVWCGADDPRVTHVGRVLRKLHVDELPQLWNVLRGEMSLIGPRPERPELVAELLWTLPGYSQRLNVKPGLTGFAQVRLPPDETVHDVRLKLAYDLYYVRHVSPWLDARILFFTAVQIVRELGKFVWLSIDLPQWKKVCMSVPFDLEGELDLDLRTRPSRFLDS